MDARRCLCEEHDLILKVFDRLETALEQARQKRGVDRDVFQPFAEFLDGFLVGSHFGKEEHGLFPLLQGRGMPHEGSPMAALHQEHEVIRALVRDFSTGLESVDREPESAVSAVLDAGSQLVELLRGHIARADHCVLGMASAMLKEKDSGEVERAFCAAERRTADDATLRRWRALAENLAARDPNLNAGRDVSER